MTTAPPVPRHVYLCALTFVIGCDATLSPPDAAEAERVVREYAAAALPCPDKPTITLARELLILVATGGIADVCAE